MHVDSEMKRDYSVEDSSIGNEGTEKRKKEERLSSKCESMRSLAWPDPRDKKEIWPRKTIYVAYNKATSLAEMEQW